MMMMRLLASRKSVGNKWGDANGRDMGKRNRFRKAGGRVKKKDAFPGQGNSLLATSVGEINETDFRPGEEWSSYRRQANSREARDARLSAALGRMGAQYTEAELANEGGAQEWVYSEDEVSHQSH